MINQCKSLEKKHILIVVDDFRVHIFQSHGWFGLGIHCHLLRRDGSGSIGVGVDLLFKNHEGGK